MWGSWDCSWVHWRVRKAVKDDGTFKYAQARDMAFGLNGWTGKFVSINDAAPGYEVYHAFHGAGVDHITSVFGDPLRFFHAPKTGDVIKEAEPKGVLITKIVKVKRPDWLYKK